MKALLKTAIAATLFVASQVSLAVTIKDQKGEFTLDTIPQRVVAL